MTSINNDNNVIKNNSIKNHPLFSSLTDGELQFLVSISELIDYKKNEIIVSEGDLVDSFYFILQGEAKVTIQDKSSALHNKKEELFLAFLTPGENIGLTNEGIFSSTGLRTATVTALSDIQLIKIHLKDFLDFLKKNKPILRKTFTEVIEKFNRLNFIKRTCPFLKVGTKKICALAEQIEEITVAEETILFHQGDQADNCYLIRSGSIEILIQHNKEKQTIILEEETLFGETAILTGGLRNATARTLTSCQLLVLPRQLLTEIVKNDESTAQSIFILMVNRLRPIRAEGIVTHKRTTSDKNMIMLLHNPKEAQVYRLTKEGWLIWEMINGHNTIQDITMLLFKEIRIFAPEMICNFLYGLYELGFVNIPVVSSELIKSDENNLTNKFFKLLQFKIMFANIDNWLTWIYQKGAWLIFTWPIQLLILLISITGIVSFFRFQFEPTSLSTIPHVVPLLIIFVLLISIAAVICHELAHALTTKHYGYQIKRMGVGWFFLGPVAFADTSELWLATSKQRIMVDLAGVYNDCFLASILAILAVCFMNHPIANFFWIFSLIIYLNSFRNLSPIKEYDGYFALADFFDRPHLREKAIANLKRKLFFKNKVDLVYWSACTAYIVIYFFLIFITLKYFLGVFSINSIFNIPVTSFSLLIAFIFIIIPIIALALEIIFYRR